MQYQIVSSVIDHPEKGSVNTFGIKATFADGFVCIIEDVSTSEDEVKALVDLCRREQPEACHLKDVVEDFLV